MEAHQGQVHADQKILLYRYDLKQLFGYEQDRHQFIKQGFRDMHKAFQKIIDINRGPIAPQLHKGGLLQQATLFQIAQHHLPYYVTNGKVIEIK